MLRFINRAALLCFMMHLLATFAFAEKLRVIISTDIGGKDPGDFQSLVHFLTYADLFEVEGLIASPTGYGQKAQIEEVLAAYRADFPNLKTYGDYPTYDALMAMTAQGALNAGAPGSGKSTEGSRRIITAARRDDPRPLWVLVWGSMTDVAQALYDDPGIRDHLRVYSIGGANTSRDYKSRDYIYNTHKHLWWIETDATFAGVYSGGNQNDDLGVSEFVATHVKGHGQLGELFYSKLPKQKMVDSASVLYLLWSTVGGGASLEDPSQEGWGGRFHWTGHGPNYWTDITGYLTEDRVHINKWREDFLRHWQTRLDRCTTPNTSLPPVAGDDGPGSNDGMPMTITVLKNDGTASASMSAVATVMPATTQVNKGTEKIRVIVSTDIGGNDPDDFQSLVHFLTYADVFDIEGLISSPPGKGRKSHIEEVLAAYRADYPNLKTYGAYPTYEALMAVTAQGAIDPGAPGSGKSTEGSQRIITAARKNDPRPLWVLVWGSLTDVAQALYDDPSIENRIRLYAVGAWNTSKDPQSRGYIFNTHEDLWWIETNSTFRGLYLGGNQKGDLGRTAFVNSHIKDHGQLGDLYYRKLSTLKMGDTSSVLYLLWAAVGGGTSLEDAGQESWGGQFDWTGHGPNYWTDFTGDHKYDRIYINEWREDFLRHWQTRLDRCAVPNPTGDTARTVVAVGQSNNGTVTLHANDTITYVPGSNFTGVDRFTYEVSDGTDDSDVVTVTVVVDPPGVSTVLAGLFDAHADGVREDGFRYIDDAFDGTDAPAEADGVQIETGGYHGGALLVTLGGGSDAVVPGMSGGWQRHFSTASDLTNVTLSFWYKLTQTGDYESDELSQVLVSVNGVFYGEDVDGYVDQIVGSGPGSGPHTTGWQYFEVYVGTLAAGEHTLTIGGFSNQRPHKAHTEILIDEVMVKASEEQQS